MLTQCNDLQTIPCFSNQRCMLDALFPVAPLYVAIVIGASLLSMVHLFDDHETSPWGGLWPVLFFHVGVLSLVMTKSNTTNTYYVTSSHVYLARSWLSWQVWWWYIDALGSYTERFVIIRSVFFYTQFNHPMIPPHHRGRACKVGTHQGYNKHKLLIQCLNISTTRISNKWVRIP